MESLIEQYGYWAVLVGTLLEGEAILVIGGFLAHRGYLSLAGVMLAAFVGTLVSDQLWFHLGRSRGSSILAKRPGWRKPIERFDALQDRYDVWLALGFRFLYGLRTISPFAFGMSSIPRLRFLVLNVLGAILWSIVVGSLGYLVGNAAQQVVGDLEHYEVEALLIVFALGVGFWLWRLRVRRQAASAEGA